MWLRVSDEWEEVILVASGECDGWEEVTVEGRKSALYGALLIDHKVPAQLVLHQHRTVGSAERGRVISKAKLCKRGRVI